MKKYMSKREREKKKKLIGFIIFLISIVLVLSLAIIMLDKPTNNGPYTYEEMLHDHDGDGIPDHGIDEH